MGQRNGWSFIKNSYSWSNRNFNNIDKVDVYLAPVYPVNEWLATDFLQDEIECRSYEQDLAKADGDNND